MSDKTNSTKHLSSNEKETIDAIYQKYVKGVIRALGSTEFYEYFMSSVANADNEIQFSNRRMEKIVDTEWIDAIENALSGFQHIIETPRNVIREDELIVNIANAKKINGDVVRHLANHASLVEDFNEETGDVHPNKVMQKYREDSIGQVYENRVVFTTLEMAYQFVKIRHDALFEAMSEEYGAKLKVKTDMESSTEAVHLDMFLHIRDIDNAMDTDDKNREVFDRISRLYRILSTNMNSHFARHMSRYPRIKGKVTKTNVLKKNKNYRAVMALMDFLKSYDNIGYTIKVTEQNPVVDEKFQEDIFRNTLFQYLVLKNHLENEKDRRLPTMKKAKKRVLKPKFIKEIIEELTEDYDLPDVEIRKVLIEELTKEQLMREEAAERRRLVEERDRRKKEEQEKARLEREQEKERKRLEREAERERIRLEKEAEEHRLLIEKMEREQEDRRRSKLFKAEIERFRKDLDDRKELRSEELSKEKEKSEDFEDAAYIVEEAERIKQEEIERNRIRRREEIAKRQREELEARQKALDEEAERRERERIERIAEEERIKKALEEQLEQEKLAQEAADMQMVAGFVAEIDLFAENMARRFEIRKNEDLKRQRAIAELENRRQMRRNEKSEQKQKRRIW